MKYLKRAAGYFLYICSLVVVIFAVLIAARVLPSDINELFRDGWQSVFKCLGVFAVAALVQPHLSYSSRIVPSNGEDGQEDAKIIAFMEDRGYSMQRKDEMMIFTPRRTAKRLAGYFCNEITMTRELGGYEIEGQTKEVTRLVYALENYYGISEK